MNKPNLADIMFYWTPIIAGGVFFFAFLLFPVFQVLIVIGFFVLAYIAVLILGGFIKS